MEKWFAEHDCILGTIKIKADNGAKTPIAQVATPQGNWMENESWKKRAFYKAYLLAAAPVMLHALEVAQFAISVEDSEAYDIVQSAIKLAKGGKL